MQLFYFLLVLFASQAKIYSQKDGCAEVIFYHHTESVLSIVENTFANVTFWIQALTCNQPNTLFTVTVRARTITDHLEYDGSVTFFIDTCTATNRTAVRCITSNGPAELHRKVNRTHLQIEWELKWMDVESGSFITVGKDLRLNVLYPSTVTSLTVNGHEANSSHIINEGPLQVTCSFDKGNPPSNFFLLDGQRKEMKVYKSEQYLNYSLNVRCKDDWPTIRCEGSGSKNNRSVKLLVKCPPHFVDKYPKIIKYTTYEKWSFNIRAHTTEIETCFLTSLPLEENSNRDVNCILTGDPPDLLLTLVLDKADGTKEERWSLRLRNEKGFSDSLVFSTHSRKYASSCCYNQEAAFRLQRVKLNCFYVSQKYNDYNISFLDDA